MRLFPSISRPAAPPRQRGAALSRPTALAIAAAAVVALGTPAHLVAQRPSARIQAQINRLPLERQVAQLVMPWLLGNYAGFDAEGLATARGWVDSLGVGGIIISIGAPADVAAKLNFLQTRSKLPLLIAADLEGGAAFRFPGATPFPTNMGVGATGRIEDAAEMARITGLEGRAVGVHLNFAPVADINNNPANPIINTRSFGEDPGQVALLTAASVRGSRAGGMLSTAKHFPGHGDTDVDSHISLPVIRGDWARLNAIELVPFRAAIAAGVEAIMSAHVALPAITGDSTIPGTLSPKVLGAMLRDSLKFGGLVVTDALDMGALVAAYGGGEAAVRAFEAGTDLLLMPSNPRDVIQAMTAAIRSGRISQARFRRSLDRVTAIKERLGLFRLRTVSLDKVGTVVGRQSFVDSARSIVRRSLVLARDSGSAIRNLRGTAGDLALITYGGTDWSTTLPGLLTRRGHKVAPFRLYPMSGAASYDSARAILSRHPNAVFSVAVRVASGSGTIAMPEALAFLMEESAAARPTALVSFGSPYLLDQAPGVQSLLLAWTANWLTEEAVANALTGAPITGRLPIALPSGEPLGGGLVLPATTRVDATVVR
ncbi:MAG: glycoside hydrolase family 3 protein [Gemmatimonadales bacterium]